MRLGLALIAAALFTASFAAAQVAPAGTQQEPAPRPQAAAPSASQAGSKPSLAASEKVDPAKEKSIRHLMELTGSVRMSENMTQMITTQVRSAMSQNLPADRLQQFMGDFGPKFNSRNPTQNVSDAMVPIYASHFSTEDIQSMIQFYESPVGKRMVATMPQVMQEAQSTGAGIERTAAISTLTEMSDRYPELKPMLQPKGAEPPAAQPGAAPGAASPPSAPPSPKPAPPQR